MQDNWRKAWTKFQKAIGAALCLTIGLNVLGSNAALAEDHNKLRMPSKRPTPRAQRYLGYDQDLLLIMPNVKAEDEEVEKALKDVKGTVIGTMGEGRLKVLIVRTEKGKLEETEKKLKQDKNFRAISRNYKYGPHWIPNDPNFTSQWHLSAINCPRAWDRTRGGGTRVAIFDSGCQASVGDLSGKTEKGYNATTWAARMTVLGGPGPIGDLFGAIGGALSGGAQTDVQGHGTIVATTAAATANNSFNVAGVAPSATVYPVQIAGSDGFTDDIAIMAGMLNMLSAGARIVNISYGAVPPVGFTNAALHAPLHIFFQEFHYVKGGLIFISAGNDGAFDPNPPVPYLNVVSALDNSMTLTDFSNWGSSITFTGPGKDIVCTDRSGNVSTVDGTSFSSPIVASIAALVWNANPALPNVAVQSILRASCFRTSAGVWTPYYGFGMPDANLAVRLASGG